MRSLRGQADPPLLISLYDSAAERLGVDSAAISPLLKGKGEVLFDVKAYEEAANCFEQAAEALTLLSTDPSLQQADLRLRIGICANRLRQHSKALGQLYESLHALQALKAEPVANRDGRDEVLLGAMLHTELALGCFGISEETRGTDHLAESKRLWAQLDRCGYPLYLSTLMLEANVLLRHGRGEEAAALAQEYLAEAQERRANSTFTAQEIPLISIVLRNNARLPDESRSQFESALKQFAVQVIARAKRSEDAIRLLRVSGIDRKMLDSLKLELHVPREREEV